MTGFLSDVSALLNERSLLAAPAALLQLWFGLAATTGLLAWLRPQLFADAARTRRWLGVAAGVCTAGLLAHVLHYPFSGPFSEHLEPTVVQIIRRLAAGESAYHPLDDASRSAMLYGPNSYVVPWLLTLPWHQSAVALKALSAGFALGGLALTLLAIRRATPARSAAMAAGAIYFGGAALLFPKELVWVRGDPQMLFWTALALWATTCRSPRIACALLGLAAGAIANVKAHGLLYVVIAASLLIPRARRADWLFGAAVAVPVAMLPFAWPGISGRDYLAWLSIASRHGFGLQEASQLLAAGGVLGGPILLAGAVASRGMDATAAAALRRRWHRAAVLAATAAGLLLLAAAKKGAGPWHLMPLVPLGAFLAARFTAQQAAASRTASAPTTTGVLLASLTVLATLGAFAAVGKYPAKAREESAWQRGLLADVAPLFAAHRGEPIAMGYAGDAAYWLNLYRADLPLATRFVVDAGALMDMQAAGLELPAATLAALRDGAVKLWLVPREGKPFTLRNWYPDAPHGGDLFGEEFRRIFAARYERIESSQYFDLWRFKG